MKKLKTALAALVVTAGLILGTAGISQAAMIPPRTVDHGTVYDCKGPYYAAGYGGYYYNCYVDYDWFAEWFLGKTDMRLILKPWYTA